MSKEPQFPLVLIEWEDSAQPVAAWRHLDDLGEMAAVECQSVGFLVHDGKRVKALAPNLGDLASDNAQASGVIRIPSRCIRRMSRLSVL